jgi:hypothetical protein
MTTTCASIWGPQFCTQQFVHPTTGEVIGNTGCSWDFFNSVCYLPTSASNIWTATGFYTVCANNIQYMTYQCLDPNGKVLASSSCADNSQASRVCVSYVWVPSAWTACVNGVETRTVTCFQEGTVNSFGNMYCNSTAQPYLIQQCNTYFFSYGPLGACSYNCIAQSAPAPCQFFNAVTAANVTVDDTYCTGSKTNQQVCYGGACPLKIGAGNMLTFSALAVAIATLFALL